MFWVQTYQYSNCNVSDFLLSFKNCLWISSYSNVCFWFRLEELMGFVQRTKLLRKFTRLFLLKLTKILTRFLLKLTKVTGLFLFLKLTRIFHKLTSLFLVTATELFLLKLTKILRTFTRLFLVKLTRFLRKLTGLFLLEFTSGGTMEQLLKLNQLRVLLSMWVNV